MCVYAQGVYMCKRDYLSLSQHQAHTLANVRMPEAKWSIFGSGIKLFMHVCNHILTSKYVQAYRTYAAYFP